MKKMTTICLALPAFLFACNNQASQEEGATESAPATNISYAYQIDKPDNWERGDPQNAAMVMSSLKAWENGDFDACVKDFADSVLLEFDYLSKKVPRDSAKAMFTRYRDELSSVQIRMEDWESVISRDKKDQWVSLWYSQKWTDKAGKTDSVYIMDDLKIQDGKITILDEKIRHYPKE